MHRVAGEVAKGVAGAAVAGMWALVLRTSMATVVRQQELSRQDLKIHSVSQRYVQQHLGSVPQMVRALDALAQVCVLDPRHEAIRNLRRIVFRVAQMLHATGKMAAASDRMGLQASYESVTRAHQKARRQLLLMRASLSSLGLHDDSVTHQVSIVASEMQKLLVQADASMMELRPLVSQRITADKADRRAAAARAAPLTPARAKQLLSFDEEAGDAVATLAGWASATEPLTSREGVVPASCHIQHLTLHLRRLHHLSSRAERSEDVDLLVRKARGAMRQLRYLFAAQVDAKSLELPFYGLDNVLARYRLGSKPGRDA